MEVSNGCRVNPVINAPLVKGKFNYKALQNYDAVLFSLRNLFLQIESFDNSSRDYLIYYREEKRKTQ